MNGKKNMKQDDEYENYHQNFLDKLKSNKYPEIEHLLELQIQMFKQNDNFYIIPQDIEELVEQLEEYLNTEKDFSDNEEDEYDEEGELNGY